MHCITEDRNEEHIITANNVNKKLSFHGWEKCVEVFSQGKGNLSHRCSQLMPQPDLSTFDQTISWSSSDEDGSTGSPNPRFRRTLSSQINFSDCKRVRRGGRRHTSAQFVRSIEKQSKEPSKKNKNAMVPDSTPNTTDPKFNSRLSLNCVSQREASINTSESFDDQFYGANASILNKRIIVCSQNIGDCSSSSSIDGISTKHTPVKEGIKDIEATSPILVTHVHKNLRKKSMRKSLRCTSEPVKVQSVPAKSSLKSPVSSPIFKYSCARRRSGRKGFPKTASKVESNEGNYSALSVATECNGSFKLEEGSVIIPQTPRERSEKSPRSSKNTPEVVASPVIGKSARRQRRPPHMAIEKSVSPILGLKGKGAHQPRLQVASTKNKLRGNTPLKTLKSGFSSEEGSEPMASLPNFDSLLQLLDENIGDQLTTELVQSQVTAKRSLNFSPESKIEKRKASDHVTLNSKDLVTAECLPASNNFIHQCARKNLVLQSQKEENTAMSTSFSNVIEEINSEPQEIDHIPTMKSVKNPTHSHKKKKLSLNKDATLKRVCSSVEWGNQKLTSEPDQTSEPDGKSNTDDHRVVKACSFNKRKCVNATTTSPRTDNNSVDVFSASPTRTFSNETLIIEEESSEPVSMASQNLFVSHQHLFSNRQENINKSGKKKLKIALPKKGTKQIDEVDIDSCSSQSPEESQSEQIERLASPCLSSPILISQLSSPAAPVTALQTDKAMDDFNAPPRKGKKKLKQDGLANRLQRLLNRQRSSTRIWQFKRSQQNKAVSSVICSDQNTSMLLIVARSWVECSHVLVQGYLTGGNARPDHDVCSNLVILVLDLFVAEKLEKIMSATQICIFSPWQALKLRGITVILCAYRIEVAPSANLQIPPIHQENATKVSIPFKEDFESVTGTCISDIIFPKVVERLSSLFQYSESNLSAQSDLHPNRPICMSTVSSLVSSHYTGKATSESLNLTVLQVYIFKQDNEKKKGEDCPCWSILGRDSTGEVCEVVLGCEPFPPSGRTILDDLKSRQATGRSYTFSGLMPVQRIAPFRVSNLWRVVSSMNIPGLSDQGIFYMLSPSNFSWVCQPVDVEQQLTTHQQNFSPLSCIFQKEPSAAPKRVNIICRVLHASYERLYVTDMATLPYITVISVNSIAYMPLATFKASVIAVFDLEVDTGDLKADKYSRISPLDEEDFPGLSNFYDVVEMRRLAGLNPCLPLLQKNTLAKTLVSYFGTVVGVDEDSAYMWPVCGLCDNELLSLGDNSERYRCEKCNGQCENFLLRMSLQVLTESPNLPQDMLVRIKLLQRTIESLLPPTPYGEEGYDMNSVLGQNIGPLRCEVLQVKDNHFILQELPEIL